LTSQDTPRTGCLGRLVFSSLSSSCHELRTCLAQLKEAFPSNSFQKQQFNQNERKAIEIQSLQNSTLDSLKNMAVH
jgi:hypothetical protein